MEKEDMKKIVDALYDEKTVYDKENGIAFFPDISGDPYQWHGIQMFYMKNFDDLEDRFKKAGGITDYVLCIPAPGAGCGNDLGYSKFWGFDDGYEEEEEDAILAELACFVDANVGDLPAKAVEIRED